MYSTSAKKAMKLLFALLGSFYFLMRNNHRKKSVKYEKNLFDQCAGTEHCDDCNH
jgi:hypothetical protein